MENEKNSNYHDSRIPHDGEPFPDDGYDEILYEFCDNWEKGEFVNPSTFNNVDRIPYKGEPLPDDGMDEILYEICDNWEKGLLSVPQVDKSTTQIGRGLKRKASYDQGQCKRKRLLSSKEHEDEGQHCSPASDAVVASDTNGHQSPQPSTSLVSTSTHEAPPVDITSELECTALMSATAVVGGTGKLPCDISSVGGERLALVMWYKEGRVSPIYSYDVRNTKPLKGTHWIAKDTLSERAHFRVNTKPALLLLEDIVTTDAGLYRCRADYTRVPTRNHIVNFTVIAPVDKVGILDKDGKHIRNYKLGPFNEGESITITCVATGGEPPPRVSWWQEGLELDNTSVQLPGRRVENTLRLDPLRRDHLSRVFTCRAENSALSSPITSAVKLMINLKPLWVRLRGDNRPLSAGHAYDLECEVVGAIPAPIVSWWKGSINLTNCTTTTSGDGNVTLSVLRFTPVVADSGKYLSCRGQQATMTDGGLEDGWKLIIHHVPIVSLELGSTVNSSVIREGADVYFECNIKSNPWIYQIRWIYNGKQLYNKLAEGVLVSNQSLVLQGVTRALSGTYTCVASNREGDGESNAVFLDVKYAPTCRPGQASTLGVARGETARVPCELEANPTTVNFTWRYNSSDGSGEILPSRVAVEPLRSVALYQPQSEVDFGSLLCWGSNDVGAQTVPCVFHLIPAGKPEKLINCSITNTTTASFTVDCLESYDGGLPQEFRLDVHTAAKKLATTVTNKVPHFRVLGLDDGKRYDLTAYAFNKKGDSPPSYMQGQTLPSTNRRPAYLPALMDMKNSATLVVSVAAAAVVVAALAAAALCRRVDCRKKPAPEEGGYGSPRTRHGGAFEVGDDHNPDVVPQGAEGDEHSEEERAFDYLKTAPPRMYSLSARGTIPNTILPYKPDNCADQLTYSELVHARMPPRPLGTTLPRPTQPLMYAQLEIAVTPPQPLYSTMDYRTTKTGIVETSSNRALPAIDRSRLRLDTANDASNMIALQHVPDGRRYSDAERF